MRTLALTAGGLGLLRPAPGTWGSLPPALLAAALVWAGAATWTIHVGLAILAMLASGSCVAWGRYAERRFGRADAPEVVADEVAGVALPVAMAVHLGADTGADLLLILLAFALFRMLDIAKPWPLRRLERLPHGWGVLADDLAAGLAAVLLLALAAALLPGLTAP